MSTQTHFLDATEMNMVVEPPDATAGNACDVKLSEASCQTVLSVTESMISADPPAHPDKCILRHQTSLDSGI